MELYKMTQPREFIDVDKLERELVSALEADRKYSRENDAKFRAVHQKVATYEEFRDIVKASHLTCLDREDITGQKERRQPWNPAAPSSQPGSEGFGCHGDADPMRNGTHSQPTTVQEFMKRWKRSSGSPNEQYLFLLSIGGHHLHEIFKVEISMGLLGEFLTVLNHCLTETGAHSDAVMQILKQLSMCSRFKLALGFLANDEKKASQQLLEKLRRHLDSERHLDSDTSADSKTACLQELTKLYAT